MFLKREEKLDISVHTWSDSFFHLTEIGNPSQTLQVNLGPIIKKLSGNPKT